MYKSRGTNRSIHSTFLWMNWYWMTANIDFFIDVGHIPPHGAVLASITCVLWKKYLTFKQCCIVNISKWYRFSFWEINFELLLSSAICHVITDNSCSYPTITYCTRFSFVYRFAKTYPTLHSHLCVWNKRFPSICLKGLVFWHKISLLL